MSDEFIASLTSSEIIRQYLKDLICDTQIPEDVIDYEDSLDAISPSVIDITKIALPAGNYHKVRICPDTLSDQMYVRIKRHNELKEAYYNIYLPKHATIEKKYSEDIEDLRVESVFNSCKDELKGLNAKYDKTSKEYQAELKELNSKYNNDTTSNEYQTELKELNSNYLDKSNNSEYQAALDELNAEYSDKTSEEYQNALIKLDANYLDNTSTKYHNELTEIVETRTNYPALLEEIEKQRNAAFKNAAAEFHAIENKPLDYTYLPYLFFPEPVKTYDTDTSFQHHTEWDFLLANLHNPSVLISHEWKYINKAVVKNYISSYQRGKL